MKIHIQSIVIAFVALIATACNSDLFIDRKLDMSDNIKISIDGDGGSETIEYQPRGLKHISINLYDSKERFTYFDREGNEIDEDSPADVIKSIVYNDPFCEFSIFFEGNRMFFSCLQNCTGEEVSVPLLLEYDYAVKHLTVNVLPGEPMYMLTWSYDKEYKIDDNYGTPLVGTRTYNNNSDDPVFVFVEPYNNLKCHVRVLPQDDWALNKEVDLPIPSFQNLDEESQEDYTLHHIGPITLGSYVNYEIFYSGPRIPVKVQAHSSVRVTVAVMVCKARFTGKLEFISPVYNGAHETKFECDIYEPYDYKIDIQQL